MQLEMFIYFDGNCREAAEFYANAFRSEVRELMTYGDAPSDPAYPLSESDRERIMYAGIPVGGTTLMLMDVSEAQPLIVGDNISPTLSLGDKDEVTRIFNALKEGGDVLAELQPAFFSEWYGAVRDKFGVIWQILYYTKPE